MILALGALPAFGAEGLRCREAARALELAEPEPRFPDNLLIAIARAETGQRTADGRSLEPWPWTVHARGESRYFPSQAEAVAHAERLLADGVASLDVGCMQINLGYHGAAFATLAEAFEPERNVAYGASFLAALKVRHGSWDLAIERYHSSDPERRLRYRTRVEALLEDERRAVRACAGEVAAGTPPFGKCLRRPRLILALDLEDDVPFAIRTGVIAPGGRGAALALGEGPRLRLASAPADGAAGE